MKSELAEVLKIEGDEVKPRFDWNEVFNGIMERKLQFYAKYCEQCLDQGIEPMRFVDWESKFWRE